MKQIYFCLFFLFISLSGFSQVLITDPNPAVISASPDENDISLHVWVINNSSETINLLWERKVKTPPAGWLTWICDMNNCYLPSQGICPETKPNVLNPGDSLDLQIHANPNGVTGIVDINMDLFTKEDPSTILSTVNTTFNVSTTSVEDPTKNAIQIFPNPTTHYFQITENTDVESVTIYDIVGNKIKSFKAHSGKEYDVSFLNQGIYLVRMNDKNNKVVKTARLSKR